MLVFSAADFEDFRVARPDMPPNMEAELEPVVRAARREPWPFRLHATYDETISRALDVFEKVQPRHAARRAALVLRPRRDDHRSQSSSASPKLGGGIAVQHRMAYQGEYFVERYGATRSRGARRRSTRCSTRGIPVGAGTDATRVAIYNPWVSLSWLVTGRTVGGTDALSAAATGSIARRRCGCGPKPTPGSPTSRARRARIEVGQLADLIVLSSDYFSCARKPRSPTSSSILTIVGGRHCVWRWRLHSELAPPLPPAMPDWSPVRTFGGYGS